MRGASPLIVRASDLKPAAWKPGWSSIAGKNDTVGYGGRSAGHTGRGCDRFGDGYRMRRRHAGGERAPLIGRVSMDMITVDLRSQPQARVDDPVVLWGEGLPVDEISALAGTISYELLCCVTSRIPRVEIE